MTPPIEAPGGQEGSALGYIVVNDGGPERQVPIFDQLFVGREYAGISEQRRLVIGDPEMSRTQPRRRTPGVPPDRPSPPSRRTATREALPQILALVHR